MIIQRTPNKITIDSPAKVNLFLEVLGKRSDGYHEVQTVLCPISLFDQLEFTPVDGGEIDFCLRLPPSDRNASQMLNANQPNVDPAWDIPADERNLVVRAVRQVQRALGTQLGCRIELTKSIPAAAGLGGGSSNTAAAVVASMLAWDKWDRSLAHQICAAIGSDIPFFLGNERQIGIAVATGRGEQCQLLAARPPLDLLLTHPPVGCATKQVYLNYANTAKKRRPNKIVGACESGEPKKIGAELFNALQFAASGLTDWIDRQLQLLAINGATMSAMSGSGSSCFAIVEEPSYEARVRQAAAACGLSRVYSVKAWYGDSIEHQVA